MLLLLQICGGLVALYFGGEALVRGAEVIGRRLGMSSLLLGLTVVAFGTSAPELAVSIDAAITGRPDIALANVVGSNLANIGLVAALVALLGPVATERVVVRQDVPMMMLSFLALVVCLLDGVIEFHEGLLLFIALAIYTLHLLRGRRGTADEPEAEEAGEVAAGIPRAVLLAAAGVALLAVGGDQLVAGAAGLAERFEVSEAWIGLTVVAVGTSLPEIAASLVAARRGHSGMAIGNVVGSNIWNSLGVLGLSAAVVPLQARTLEWHMLGAMLAAGLLLWWMLWRSGVIGRWSGALLLVGYLGYQVAAF